MNATEAMATMPAAPAVSPALVERILLAGILATVAVQLHLVFATDVNWDEFHYLSQVHEYVRGELVLPLQTVHVHLFSWLPSVAGGEIAQVEWGRVVMLAAHCGTLALIYVLARDVAGRTASLLAVLAFATLSDVVSHGASFRVDPLAGFLVMGGLVAFTRERMSVAIALAAVLAPALAAMVTVKVVLWAPTFIGLFAVAGWRSEERVRLLLRWVGLAAGALAAFAALYALHSATLAAGGDAKAQAMLANSAGVTLGGAGFLPRAEELADLAGESPVHVALIVGALVAALVGARRGARGASAALGAGSLLVCFLFYRNAYPYFIAFIAPPATLLVAFAAERHLRGGAVRLALASALVLTGALAAVVEAGRGQERQAALLERIHAAFPEPVAYFDRNGMVASFPRAGFFMSSWGMRNYHARGEDVFRARLLERTVPLVVSNRRNLWDALTAREPANPALALRPGDRATLRENYARHAPFLWIAAKRVRLAGGEASFEILVPGRYRLHTGEAVTVNGKALAPGGTVTLARGTHTMSGSPAHEAELRFDVASEPVPGEELHTIYSGL